jgi:esterase/lipase superfamily enzyme
VILDIFERGSGSTKSDDRLTRKRSRLRKLSICLGLVLVAAGLKFFAFVPGMMQAATLVSIFSTPSATGNAMMAQAPTVDANGVKSYSVTSAYQGGRSLTVRVLEPANPAAGRPRRLLYVLPVEAGISNQGSQYGDGLEELRRLDVQNRFNLTLIAPSFAYEPWYGDNDTDTANSMETFIVRELVPWGDTFLPAGTTPQRFLVGFSKSGNGALSLIFRHPDTFTAAAAWDAPAQLKALDAYWGLHLNFGTQANFDSYFIPSLVKAGEKPFLSRNRLWISGDQSIFTADMNKLHSQLKAAGIRHTWVTGGTRAHNWTSGWLDGAVTALDATSLQTALPPDSKKRRFSGDDLNSPQMASAHVLQHSVSQ